MTQLAPSTRVRTRGRAVLAMATAAALGLTALVSLAPAAEAAPKGTLAAKRINLANNEVVPVTLTNYPAVDVKINLCEVSKSSALTVGACAPGTTIISVPDAGAGRGDASVDVIAKETFGAIDCTVDWCAWVTAAVDPLLDPANDAGVKATVTFTPAPALTIAAPGGLSISDPTSVTASGAGFRPGTVVRVFQCQGLASVQSLCDFASFVEAPAADANGAFEAVLNAKPSITIGGSPVDCTAEACSIQTSSKTAGADTTQQSVSAELVFGKQLSVSKAAGLAYNGESVTVSGVQFAATTPLWVSQCNLNAAPGSECNNTIGEFAQVTTDANGAFSAPIKVKGSFSNGAKTIDCNAVGVQCGLQTVKPGDFGNPAHYATTAVAFAAKPPAPPAPPAPKAPTKAKITSLKIKGKVSNQRAVVKWAKSVAQGSPITGYTVQVKVAGKDWKKAGATSAAIHQLTWTKVKPGKKYWFRVVAKSAAGNSTSTKKSVKSKE